MNHTKELIELAPPGPPAALVVLLMENPRLVYSIAKRFAGR